MWRRKELPRMPLGLGFEWRAAPCSEVLAWEGSGSGLGVYLRVSRN
jgi:hypothetical protein